MAVGWGGPVEQAAGLSAEAWLRPDLPHWPRIDGWVRCASADDDLRTSTGSSAQPDPAYTSVTAAPAAGVRISSHGEPSRHGASGIRAIALPCPAFRGGPQPPGRGVAETLRADHKPALVPVIARPEILHNIPQSLT